MGKAHNKRGKQYPIPMVGVNPNYRFIIGLMSLFKVILLMIRGGTKQKDPCVYGYKSPGLSILPISSPNICTASPGEDIFSLSLKEAKNKIHGGKKRSNSCHCFHKHSRRTGWHACWSWRAEGMKNCSLLCPKNVEHATSHPKFSCTSSFCKALFPRRKTTIPSNHVAFSWNNIITFKVKEEKQKAS